MKKEYSQTDMAQMGVNIGIYVVAELIAEGYDMTPRVAMKMGRWAISNLEQQTEKPGEDIALRAKEPLEALRSMLADFEKKS